MNADLVTDLRMALDWERLDVGSSEERACFGMLVVQLGGTLLTEGHDGFIDCFRRGPLVSGYHLAEWLAWNWWRLTHEPRPDAPAGDWQLTHCMSTVGEGYLWPNITIWSDRQRTVLGAQPTHPQGFSAYRYTADRTIVLPTTGFVSALDQFMAQIQGKLRADGVALTNFDRIWGEVLEERAAPDLAYYRELEAVLGRDADEDDDSQIQGLIADAESLGRDALIELSAGSRPGQSPTTAAEIRSWAADLGQDTRPADTAAITGLDLSRPAERPAWRLGCEAARLVRAQHGLSLEPLPDRRLAELCAVAPASLDTARSAPLAFCLDHGPCGQGSIVYRSTYRTGRRFELARLLGDRLTGTLDERLIPLTRGNTYRQKVQRAFAAELLCPFDALGAFLDGDYSEQAREDAAQYFEISERAVSTQLVNHGCLGLMVLEAEM